MHTYWSDGRIFPEQAIEIYKRLGYDFIGLSDHNVFAADLNTWKTVEEKEGKWPPAVTRPLFDAYVQSFGQEVETRKEGEKTAVRLKTYAEMQAKFQEPGKFLLLPAVEVTQVLNGINVHLNYVNLPAEIPSVKGGPPVKSLKDAKVSVSALIRSNGADVAQLAGQMRRPSLLMLNHPQWVYGTLCPKT
jgi:hypothetical protein